MDKTLILLFIFESRLIEFWVNRLDSFIYEKSWKIISCYRDGDVLCRRVIPKAREKAGQGDIKNVRQ